MNDELIGSLKWCLKVDSLRDEVLPDAAKLYTLCATLPDVPAGKLFDLATKEITLKQFLEEIDK